MLITHKIQMDIQLFSIVPYLNVVCGDEYTRQLELTLFSGGVEWPVPEGASAVIRFSRSDGHGGLYDTLPDGTAACAIKDNVVTAILAPQVLSATGFATVSVALVKDEQILGLFPVGINVKADPSQNVIPPEDYFNYLNIGSIGDLKELKTEEKSTLVAAINELFDKIGNGNDSSQNGNDGFSPVATVEQTNSGAIISITDKNGTTTATITNGKAGYTPQKDVDYFDGKDGADGSPGQNGKDGSNGVSATHSWNGTVLTITSASGTSSADLKGEPGNPGKDGSPGSAGKDGTSVTVKSVSESTADGGSNVVTFSDGKTVTIKNGSKGNPGATPVKGTDYFTQADINEIVNAVYAKVADGNGVAY